MDLCLWQVLLNDGFLQVTAGHLAIVFAEYRVPLFFVGVQDFFKVGQVRENFNHLSEGRFHDEVDKAQLGLCDICRAPVEKLTDGELVHFLEVALSEELLE